ncbi:adenylosuccinate lyase [Aquimarina sp. 2201CG14-23]|uniref:adenylosuccinate lyase n=1 Tax=Aquimarina mycalae TaxID=3040073 RepID=UPI002477F019|nr:adenylosuccinate lyase [Aquimarina sp. 2201CG14-23]MDH7444079.1 adenylosuccinate lyase [Aquimarina sp. 2201CG14-23]
MINLKEEIKRTNHSREKRNEFANLILQNPKLLPQLLEICSQVDDEISCKASWGLEFLSKNNIEAILPYLDSLMPILPTVYQDPAVRPIAKICEYLTLAYYKSKNPEVRKQLTSTHREKITEACFDWLISDQKVAPKAYSMTSLYLLGTEFDWVHPELKITLENNYSIGSAAYKARSRMILKKL